MAKRTASAAFDQSGRPSELSIATAPFTQIPSSTEPTHSLTASPTQRVTRSAAKLAADAPPTPTSNPPPNILASAQSRKRKASLRDGKESPPSEREHHSPPKSSPRRTKRLKTTAPAPAPAPVPEPSISTPRQTRRQAAMSQAGSSSRHTESTPKTSTSSSSSSSKQKSTRGKHSYRDNNMHETSPTQPSNKRQNKRDSNNVMDETDDMQDDLMERNETGPSSPNDGERPPNNSGLQHNEDHGDPFRSHLFGSRSPLELQSTLRALSGMMSGISTRLRDILANLRIKDDPSIQLIALQELSDLLLVSNEDTLAGQFAADSFVTELVSLMEPSETGEENPEIMLLACRCLANLMEAIRGSVASVVYGGAVPVLCRKLLDIQFIDLAEQALSTLAKISVDFPASIVREGGLTACLTYLDFFPTSTQRTAVTTAANCCRNLPSDSFHVVRDVMPTLLNVLSSSDQKVVEQGCLCVCRVVESFKYKPEKLEELIEPAMLRAILRLLLPGTTNLIGSHIHTQFLRVLGIVCRSSPRLSMELLKMDVVDTLYQILTGVSPPTDLGDGTIKIESVHIMQALVHRPREQIYETLNVICELLPGVPGQQLLIYDRMRTPIDDDVLSYSISPKAEQTTAKRVELLQSCKKEIRRFATILLPTLTDTYSSTVNFAVRQKVLLAQLKMLQYLDVQIIEDALRNVQYASFLAGILSQDDHVSLVALALRCAELLFKRLKEIYQYQFHREGVITEIVRLAERPVPSQVARKKELDKPPTLPPIDTQSNLDMEESRGEDHAPLDHHDEDEESHEENDYYDDEHDHDHDHDHDQDHDDMSESESESSEVGRTLSQNFNSEKLVSDYAKEFLRIYQDTKEVGMHDKALEVLRELKARVSDISRYYKSSNAEDGYPLFEKLAAYFSGDAIESVTSAELLNSGVIQALLDVIGDLHTGSSNRAKTDFLRAFMVQNGSTLNGDTGLKTPFSVLIHKLQDLLSRTEHFEVITVHHSSYESRNTASMLSKQLRLRLIAEDESDIPKPYKNIMVSIHAIANFKTLDEYLRPRIAISERSRASRHRDAAFLSQFEGASRPTDTPGENKEPKTTSERKPMPSHQPSSSKTSGNTRAAKSSEKSKIANNTSQPTTPGGSQDRSGRSRRSTRRQPAPPPPPPDDESEESDEPLECADERQLSDDDEGEEEEEDEGALDAIVDDLDEDLSENGGPDPTAVNMEVASSGKVTARRDDGTKVATPAQSTPSRDSATASASASAAQSLRNSLALAGRPFASYAAAMTSLPQDWHIEFSIDDKSISHDTTIYRAIHHNRNPVPDNITGSVWSTIHTIRFKRVQGPPPAEPSKLSPSAPSESSDLETEDLPESLTKATTTSSILKLLRVLHRLNSQLDYILAEVKEPIKVSTEAPAQFINTKLTAKLNRQLEEPLIVASSCLPNWSEDLARHFPFLFPFETRHLFLQSTSFGYARSMTRWQGSHSGDDSRRDQRRDDRPFTRLQRQKVRISRTRILESALKVMELYGSSSSVLEVEYFEEVGTGLGPTLEFYSTVSKEFARKKLKLWRDHDSNDGDYVYSKLGLFPAPMSPEQLTQDSGKRVLAYFRGLGKFVARSMLDSRIIDVAFNPTFFRIANNITTFTPSIGAIKAVDPGLASSLMMLKQFANEMVAISANTALTDEAKSIAIRTCQVRGVTIGELGLDFTLPGYPNVELLLDGAETPLTMANVDAYVSKVIDMTLGTGIRRQIEAFRSGFSEVFSYSALRAFTPNELVMLFGQVEEDWSIETLMDSIKADHGFNLDSRSVRNLLETMSKFTLQQRRDFLQFVTGSPKLPIGGFKSLTPMFTVVCRPSDPPYTSDDYLPSVMTCVNYLKLPDYSSAQILRKQLDVAMREGQGAFHLS